MPAPAHPGHATQGTSSAVTAALTREGGPAESRRRWAATPAGLGLIRRGYCATTVPRATTPALPARSVAATSIV